MTRPWHLPALVKNRNFTALWAAQSISTLGDALTNLTLIVLVNHLTHSTTAVAGLAIVIAVPRIAISLLAGAWVDRLDRRRIMLVSDALRAALLLTLLVLTRTDPHIGWIYAIAFAQSAVGTFFTPARAALMQVLVPASAQLQANSLIQAATVIAELVGTTAAGLLVGLTGTYWPAFGIDAATFVASAALVATVRTEHSRPGAEHRTRTTDSIREGLRAVRDTPVLRALLFVFTALTFALSPMAALLTPYVVDELHIRPTWLGVITSGDTIGSILGGLAIAALAVRVKPTSLLTGGLAALAAVFTAVAVARHVPELVAVYFAFGLVTVALQAGVSALAQQSVDNALMGRFMSLMSMIPGVVSVAALALAGTAASAVGVRTVLAALAVTLATAALVARHLLRRATAPGEQNKAEPAEQAPRTSTTTSGAA